jgi:hypothetical protein
MSAATVVASAAVRSFSAVKVFAPGVVVSL